jgi:hypothetical protein
MQVLQSTKELIGNPLHVIDGKLLLGQNDSAQVCFHKLCHQVHVFKLGLWRSKHVQDALNGVMLQMTHQDNLPIGPLCFLQVAEHLGNLFDGNKTIILLVMGRTKNGEKKKKN